jgi:hypothetical protein
MSSVYLEGDLSTIGLGVEVSRMHYRVTTAAGNGESPEIPGIRIIRYAFV